MPHDGQHVFLTGATGFFGRSLLRYIDGLQGDGRHPWCVTAMTRSVQAFLLRYPEFAGKSWLHFHEGNILNGAVAFPACIRPTHVLHAAADSTPAADMSALDRLDQIVAGTRNVLDFAKNVGAKRFLLTSSGDVYGAQPSEVDKIPEHYSGSPDPMNPRNSYGIGKKLAEHLCAIYGAEYDLEVVVARCFAFVGPDLPMDEHFAIGNFIRDAICGDEILVNGDGTPLRSYLYQSDLAHWLMTLLAVGCPGQAYNVGSDQEISIADLALLVQAKLAPEKKIRILKKINGSSEARSRYIPFIGKAKKEFGLKVEISLGEAILKSVAKGKLSRVPHA